MTQSIIRQVANVEHHRAGAINLIASENRISPLARRLLGVEAGSRYFFEGSDPPAFPGGAEYAEIQFEGERLLGHLGRARHVNMRPLSGLHAMTVLIAALTEPGDCILSLAPESGGHYATGPLAKRIGRRHGTFALTPDLTISEEYLEDGLRRLQPRLLYMDQCHGLFPVDLQRVVRVTRAVSPNTLIHADVSHGLGLVLGGVLDNPLEAGCDTFGGSTHKTFPGPQKGVLLTNEADLAARIAEAQFHLISNHHLNAAVCLSVALWEFANFGGATYASSIPAIAASLGEALSEHGIAPVRIGGRYTGWHQLWISESSLPLAPQKCAARLAQAGVMVNVLPDLPGLAPFALRLGVSEICHLGFAEDAVDRLAALIALILRSDAPAASFRPATAALLDRATFPYDYQPERELLGELPEAGARSRLCVPWSSIDELPAMPIFVRGHGCRVVDLEGRSWLDAKSSALNATLGYGRADIADAARDQLVRLMHSDAVGALNAPSLALAQRVAQLTGDALTHTLFCNSGSEAAEAALKIALIYQQVAGKPERHRVVTFENSYHGCTTGALALTQLAFPKSGLSWLPNELAIPMPMPRANDASLAALHALLEGPHGSSVAAVILEPVQGIGGIRAFPDDYLVGLRRLCDRTGVLLIMDEVLTGFGRTGRMFAYERSGAVPDILMTSKGLTAGYAPLSAVSISENVFRMVSKDPYLKGLRHGHTMSGNAVACAVGLRVLDALEDEDVLGNARRMGERLFNDLSTLANIPGVVEVRGYGLMIGIELATNNIASHAVEECRSLGLLLRAQMNVLQIFPPLTISAEEADCIANLVKAGIHAATRAAA